MKKPTYGVIELADGSRVLIDCTLSETVTREADVTEYPTESGSTISDNIRPRPISIALEGIISNTPLDPIASVRVGSGHEPAATAMRERLEKAFNDRDVVKVIISTGKYEKMAFEFLEFPRDRTTGDVLRFSARFKQITIVSNARVAIKRTSTRTGGGKVKRGGQPVSFGPPKTLLWRKGGKWILEGRVLKRAKRIFVGGAPTIIESEYVAWVTHEELGVKGTLADPSLLSGDQQPVSDGAWYHMHGKFTGTGAEDVAPNALGKLLTGEEYRRFLLDMERDRKLRDFRESHPLIRTVLGRFGSSFDKAPDKTKRPIDLNAANRRNAPDVVTQSIRNLWQR